MAKPKPPKTPADEIIAFRQRHGIDQRQLDRLMGFSSDGRSTRRWEQEDAPYYISIIMAYVDRYGPEVMEEMAEKFDRERKKAALTADN